MRSLLLGIVLLAGTCGAGVNLLPVDFTDNNVGGFLGWEVGGATVRILPERGPEGGKILRFTDNGGEFRFAHENRRLAPGGRYRLSANVRARNLAGPKRFELMLHNWPWSKELKATLPRETDGQWRAVSWEGVLPSSEKDEYDCTVYSSGPLAADAFFDLADLKLEALDEKAKKGASPIPAYRPYRARICPVDPQLDEIDPRAARVRFYYGGPVKDEAGRPLRLTATLGGIVREVEWGADHLATVDFGSVPTGELPLRVETPSARNDYTAIIRPIVANPTPLRRLNNLVSEIFAKPLANGDFEFTLAKAGRVYVGTDRPYETVVADIDETFRNVVRYRPRELNGSARFLEAGRHVVRVRGVPPGTKGTLVARLVKEITAGGFSNSLAGKYVRYPRDERAFERMGLLGTLSFTATRIGMPASVRAKFADRGVEIIGDVSCAAKLPLRDDLKALTRHFTDNTYATFGIPFNIDENGINIGTLKRYNATEAMWEAYRLGIRVDANFEDGYRARFNRPGLDYPDLSAYVNLGKGRSFAVSEGYWRSPVDWEEFAATTNFIYRQIREMRALVPSAPKHLVYYLNGFMSIGAWTSWIHPHVDMKAFDATILHMLATDPEFADIGGVGCAAMYCDEDYLRWMYAAFRHYAIEGRTEDFCAQNGCAIYPGHMKNGDFDSGFDGWQVSAAESGSLSVGYKKGFGVRHQQRRCWWFRNGTYDVGEHFAAFVQSEKGPNRLSQELTGLKPGELYQVTFATLDGAELEDNGARQGRDGLCAVRGRDGARPSLVAAVEGADEIEGLRFVQTETSNPAKAHVVQTRIVFRARTDRARLVFSDWTADCRPQTEAGAKRVLNYVGCRRFFVRDEIELKDLQELLRAAQHPSGVVASPGRVGVPSPTAAGGGTPSLSDKRGIGTVPFPNGGFEDGAKSWSHVDGKTWRIEKAGGRGGSAGLVYDNDDPAYYGTPTRTLSVEGGEKYKFGVWVKVESLERTGSADGKSALPRIYFDWSDANGKWIGAAFAKPVVDNQVAQGDGWVRWEGETMPLPSVAATAKLIPLINSGFVGKVRFDDFSFERIASRPVGYLVSSRYRNEAVDGSVRFHAMLHVNAVRTPPETLAATFVFTDAKGVGRRMPVTSFTPEEATAEVRVDDLKVGEQTVRFELNCRDGSSLGTAACRFTRLTTPVARRVTFDRCGRTLVDGRKFLPLGMFLFPLYTGPDKGGDWKIGGAAYRRYAEGPFNCIMPYGHYFGSPTREELDWCRANGLMVIYDLHYMVHGEQAYGRFGSKSDEEACRRIRAAVETVRDHPAVLCWYLNDEAPAKMASVQADLLDFVHGLDGDHPVYSVTDKPELVRLFRPAYDVLGLDPYPIGNRAPISLASDWPLRARRETWNTSPLWQVPQAFDWGLIRDWARADGAHYPTKAELANMCWQAIAAGANGLIAYAYTDAVRTLPDLRGWKEACAVFGAIRASADLILSDPGPAVVSAPQGALARTWRLDDGSVKALVVNVTEKAVRGSVRLADGGTFACDLESLEHAIGDVK